MRSCRASTVASWASTVRTSTRCSLCCPSMLSRSSEAVLGALLLAGAVGLRWGDAVGMGRVADVALTRGTVGDDWEPPFVGLGPGGRTTFFGNGISAIEVVGEGALLAVALVGVLAPGVLLATGVAVATGVADDFGDIPSSPNTGSFLVRGEVGDSEAGTGTVAVGAGCAGVTGGVDCLLSCVADGKSPNLMCGDRRSSELVAGNITPPPCPGALGFKGSALSLGVITGVDTSWIGVTVGRWNDVFQGRPSLVTELVLRLDDKADVFDVLLSFAPAKPLLRRGDMEKLAMADVTGNDPTAIVVRRRGAPKVGSSRV